MLGGLLFSALLMGLAGGPHCLAMCGTACMGVSRWPGQSAARSLLLFQTGRVVGYSTLGALAAVSMNALGWLAEETSVFHPLWSMLHIAAVLWGVWLMWRAEQPLWVNRTAQRVWQAMSGKTRAVSKQMFAPLWLGMAWALLPCGLLYSALLVAMFTAGALQGALVMAAFALGGGLMLTVFPWLWSHISNWGQVPINNQRKLSRINWNLTPIRNLTPIKSMTSLGTRISGLVLALTAAWGLYSGLTHSVSPWCLPGLNA
jgi:sulfite exporter TauE/SafE